MSPNDLISSQPNSSTVRPVNRCLHYPQDEPANWNPEVYDPKKRTKLYDPQNIDLSLGRSQYHYVQEFSRPSRFQGSVCKNLFNEFKQCSSCEIILPEIDSDFSLERKPKHETREIILEEFEGYVDRIIDDTAYVTLRSEHGDVLEGEYSAAALKKKQIGEGRRFFCRTVQTGDAVRVEMEASSEPLLSKEDEQALDREIDDLFKDGDFDGDY